MVEDLTIASRDVGLSINKTKTMILINIKKLDDALIDGEPISRTDGYKYLGQTLSFTDKTGKELKIRRQNAWKAFWVKKQFWKSRMSIKSKIRVLESTIIPILTYGAQTCATTEK